MTVEENNILRLKIPEYILIYNKTLQYHGINGYSICDMKSQIMALCVGGVGGGGGCG